ncbi:MAG: hypothetical protein Q4F54_05100 [Coriobacteriia bacterium]|nr:hypothetical protein [Coriobacteriia bacterium]
MKTDKLEEMGMTFLGCRSLRTVKFNKEVYPKKKYNVKFKDTFRECYNLQAVDLGGMVVEPDGFFFPNSGDLKQIGAYFAHNSQMRELSLYLSKELKYDQYN